MKRLVPLSWFNQCNLKNKPESLGSWELLDQMAGLCQQQSAFAFWGASEAWPQRFWADTECLGRMEGSKNIKDRHVLKWSRVEKGKSDMDLQLRSLSLSFFLAFLLGALAFLFDHYIEFIHAIVNVFPIEQGVGWKSSRNILAEQSTYIRLNPLVRRSCSGSPFWLRKPFLLQRS